jgi:hypothetical protein
VNNEETHPAISLVATGPLPGTTSVSAVGDVIHYTFTVTNIGDVQIDSLTLSAVNTEAAGLPVNLVCSPTSIAVMAEATCTAEYTVESGDIPSTSGEIIQTFTAHGVDHTTGAAVNSNTFAVAVDVHVTQAGFTAIIWNTTNTNP